MSYVPIDLLAEAYVNTEQALRSYPFVQGKPSICGTVPTDLKKLESASTN
jgi:hypothetical protein